MSAPQPKPATDDEDESAEVDEEVKDEMRDQVDDQLDELDEAEPAGDTGPPSGSDPFDDDEDAEEIDLDLADTDIGEEVDDDAGADSADETPFDGVDDSRTTDSGPTRGRDPMDAAGDAMGMAEDLGGGSIETAINEGAGRLAVVGLPETFVHNGETKEKEDLEDEFVEVFETFRLGAFGEQAADEYLDMDAGEVDPLWGFAASLVISTVLVVQMRPDGDELVRKLKQRT